MLPLEPGRITSSKVMETTDIQALVGWRWNEVDSTEFYPEVSIDSLSLWMEMLILKDISQEFTLLDSTLCIYYSKHKNIARNTVSPQKKNFNPRAFGCMDNPTDIISMQQVLSASKKLRFFAI